MRKEDGGMCLLRDGGIGFCRDGCAMMGKAGGMHGQGKEHAREIKNNARDMQTEMQWKCITK